MDGMVFGDWGIGHLGIWAFGHLGIWVFGTASILCAVSGSFDLRTKQVLLHNVIHFILARNCKHSNYSTPTTQATTNTAEKEATKHA